MLKKSKPHHLRLSYLHRFTVYPLMGRLSLAHLGKLILSEQIYGELLVLYCTS